MKFKLITTLITALLILLFVILFETCNRSNDEIKAKEREILIQLQKGKETDSAIKKMKYDTDTINSIIQITPFLPNHIEFVEFTTIKGERSLTTSKPPLSVPLPPRKEKR